MFVNLNQKVDLVHLKPSWTKPFAGLFLLSIIELAFTFFWRPNWEFSWQSTLFFAPLWFGVFLLALRLAYLTWNYNYEPNSVSTQTFWDYNPQPKVAIIVHVNSESKDLSPMRATLIACKKQKYRNLDIIVVTDKPNFTINSIAKILQVGYFITNKPNLKADFVLKLQSGQLPEQNLLLESIPYFIKNPNLQLAGLCILPHQNESSTSLSKAFSNFYFEQNSFWNLTPSYQLPEFGVITRSQKVSNQSQFLPNSVLWTNSDTKQNLQYSFNWVQLDLAVYLLMLIQLAVGQSNLATGFFFLIFFLISLSWKKMFKISLVVESLMVSFYYLYQLLADQISRIIGAKTWIIMIISGVTNLALSGYIWQMLWTNKIFFSWNSLAPSLILLFVYGINLWLFTSLYIFWRNPNHEAELSILKSRVNNWQKRRIKS
jgi:hypothetical protein